MKKTITFILVLIVVILVVLYFYPVQEENSNTVEFIDESLGLSFEYPIEFGNVITKIRAGETGKILFAEFSDFPGLIFGGISDDFSEGRGGVLTDTRGFVEKDGKYYFNFVSAKNSREVEPYKVISNNIIMLDDNSFEAERNGVEGPIMAVGQNSYAILVNLLGEDFGGIVIWNWNANGEGLPLPEFLELADSIKVFEPK